MGLVIHKISSRHRSTAIKRRWGFELLCKDAVYVKVHLSYRFQLLTSALTLRGPELGMSEIIRSMRMEPVG